MLSIEKNLQEGTDHLSRIIKFYLGQMGGENYGHILIVGSSDSKAVGCSASGITPESAAKILRETADALELSTSKQPEGKPS